MAKTEERKEEAKPTTEARPSPVIDDKLIDGIIRLLKTPLVILFAALLAIHVAYESRPTQRIGKFLLNSFAKLASRNRETSGTMLEAIKARLSAFRFAIRRWVITGLSALTLLAVVTIAASQTGHLLVASWVLVVMAAVVILLAVGLQAVFEGIFGSRKLALGLSRPFAILALIIFFIAAMMVLLPDSWRSAYVITTITIVVMLITSYSVLEGRKSNTIYWLMVAVTVILALGTLGLNQVIERSPTLYARIFLRQRVALEETTLDGIKEDIPVKAGTILYVDWKTPAEKSKTDDPRPRVEASLRDGNVWHKGYVPYDAIGPVLTPTPALTPAPTPVVSADSKSAPPPAAVPAVLQPAATPAPTPLPMVEESTVVAESDKWTDTGLIGFRGDLFRWGPFSNRSDLERLRFRIGYSADIGSPGISGDNGDYVGFNGVLSNHTSAPLRISVTHGDPIEVHLVLRRGADTTRR